MQFKAGIEKSNIFSNWSFTAYFIILSAKGCNFDLT